MFKNEKRKTKTLFLFLNDNDTRELQIELYYGVILNGLVINLCASMLDTKLKLFAEILVQQKRLNGACAHMTIRLPFTLH